MQVLSVHNFYRMPGGEDQVFAAEAALLRDRGHQVTEFTRSNAEFGDRARWQAALTAVWSRQSARQLESVIRSGGFSVCHFHNFFPLISPAAYGAAQRQRVPVVQTLHNYRLLCPGACLFRRGRVCQLCLASRVSWPGIRYGCYRSSRLGTACVAAMIAVHRTLGTWWRQVDCYIALSEFARRKFIEGGLPAERIEVKPNFVHPDPGRGDGAGSFALFVGRLSDEKDVRTLIRAAALVGPGLRLKIAGDGPQSESLAGLARGQENVQFLGWQPRPRVIELMKAASFLVVPSAWYEGPLVVLEAFAVGLPVVASRLGPLQEMVDDTHTGWLFAPGDAEDLAAKMDRLLAHPAQLAAVRGRARAEFKAKYTVDTNGRRLEQIYQLAAERNRGAR